MGQILGRGNQVVNGWKSRKIKYRVARKTGQGGARGRGRGGNWRLGARHIPVREACRREVEPFVNNVGKVNPHDSYG